MKVIRNSVFETNSSSVHTVSVSRNKTGKYDYSLPLDKSGRYTLGFDRDYDFGWGVTAYCDLEAKLNYLACLAYQTHIMLLHKNKRPFPNSLETILKISDIKKLERAVKKHVKGFTGFSIDPTTFSKGTNFQTNESYLYIGGIDHQSVEDYKDLADWLEANRITLENFLFNPFVTLHIENDNMW